MAKLLRILLVIGIPLSGAGQASAFWHTGATRPATTPSYQSYYLTPVYYPAVSYYYYPVYTVPTVVCPPTIAPVAVAPVSVAPFYAQPTPAPASGGNPPPAPPSPRSQEPPLLPPQKPAPKVSEFKSRSDAGSVPQTSARLSGDTCMVGFWNLADRDVQLVVDGEPRTLTRGQAVTLPLPRHFSWRVDQQPMQSEAVPGERHTHEIVIRP